MNKDGTQRGKRKIPTPEISKDLKIQRDTKRQNKARNKVIQLKEEAETQDCGDKGKICTEGESYLT